MQAGDPAPAKGVRCGIAVQQVPVKEIRPQPPGQAKGKNPDRRKPHPCVIVQIACVHQLGHPGVKTLQPRLATRRALYITAQAAVAVKGGKVDLQPAAIAGPDLRTAFQPALEIAAPDHLLHELLGVLGAVRGQCGCHRILLQYQPAPDVGRQNRHGLVRAGPMVGVAAIGIAAAHAGDKCLQDCIANGAGGGPVCH